MVPERRHLPSCVGCTGLVDVGLPQGWGCRRDAHGAECLRGGAELRGVARQRLSDFRWVWLNRSASLFSSVKRGYSHLSYEDSEWMVLGSCSSFLLLSLVAFCDSLWMGEQGQVMSAGFVVPRKQPLLLRRAVGPRGSLRGCHPMMDGVVVSRDAQTPHAVLEVVCGCPICRALASCLSAQDRSCAPHLLGPCSSGVQVLRPSWWKMLLAGCVYL